MGSRNHEAPVSGLDSLERRVRLGFFVAAVVLVLIGVLSYASVVRFRGDARQVDHTHQVLNSLAELRSDLTAVESAQRGFVISGREEQQKAYDAAVEQIQTQLLHIRELTKDNPNQGGNLNALSPLIAERLSLMQARIEVRRNQGLEAAQRRGP
jgi:CHASE3 domain sensor protein